MIVSIELLLSFLSGELPGKGQYSQRGIMDEIFKVDATAVLCKVSKTAVTHWTDKERKREKRKRKRTN